MNVNSAKSRVLAGWDKQLSKVILDLAILACLQSGRLYGLQLLKILKNTSNLIVVEGTIYPILNRLKTESLIQAEWVYENEGHPRKYYSLTSEGKKKLIQMSKHWIEFSEKVNKLLEPLAKEFDDEV